MNHRTPLIALAALCAATLGASPAHAAVGPVYAVKADWSDTNLPPGGEGTFSVLVRNVGDAAPSGAVTITDELPQGVTAKNLVLSVALANRAPSWCTGEATETVQCIVPAEWASSWLQPPGVEGGLGFNLKPSGYLGSLEFEVSVDPGAEGTGVNTATAFGGGARPATDVDTIDFSATPSQSGLVPGSFEADVFNAAYPFGPTSRLAGDHPFEQRVDFDLTSHTDRVNTFEGRPAAKANGALKTVEVTLPRGLIGNPQALPKCDPVDFAEFGAIQDSTACPSDTQVGYLNIRALSYAGGGGLLYEWLSHVPLYNLVPPHGTPVDLGFRAGGYVLAHIYATLDPAQNYAIKSVTPNISSMAAVHATEVTLWGVPADPAHDRLRFYPELRSVERENSSGEKEDVSIAAGAPWGSAPIRPFFTNPMDCGFGNGGSRIRLDFYEHPGVFTPAEEWPDPLNVTGCDDLRFSFEPEVALQPTDRHAGAPTGLDVHLNVPLRSGEVNEATKLYAENKYVQGISTPPIKKAVVTLPEGMTINPSAAQGLGFCTPAQIGLVSTSPIRFNADPVTCPDSSQYGTLILHTPLLPVDEQPTGFIYIARQNDNPFGNFLSLYLVIEEPERGILVKIPGKVDLNPVTGQITTTFDELPQFPVSDMQMSLKGGLRAGLVNPQTCGEKTITATFYSWADPSTPIEKSSSYDITQSPDGSPCVPSLGERPFDPELSGGTLNPLAGSFSPLELRMTRTDEDQELSVVEGTAPPGLTASLRGVAECSDAQIAAAANPERTGTEEQNSSSCPASSQVGTVDAGAGVGQILTYVKGRVYLAGPYEGAPVSGVAIVPAVAGPFDLGTIVTRAPVYVDPETAQISLKTDPLPQIFKGVPVRVRDIRVHLDRQSFTLNPTNCEAMSLNGTLFSTEGKSKASSTRFQAADCASLGFKPKLSLKLKGAAKRGGHPALTAVLKARAGDANIASAQVALPYSEFLDQGHLNNICTRVQFKANQCPAASIYGHAVAKTPLFDTPLEGPVYLRSNPAHKLPDLVAAIKGPASLPVEVDLAMRVDSFHGGIRTTVERAPDAPVTEFTLSMQGGKKGLLENSENLCAGTFRATARFRAQNGRRVTLHPALEATSCKGKGRKGVRHERNKKHRAKQRSGRS